MAVTHTCFSLFLLLPRSHSGSGGDYTSLSMNLTFNSVTTSQIVIVATSTDTVIEGEETFTLALTENDDVVDVMPLSAIVTITDQTSKSMDRGVCGSREESLPVSFLSLSSLFSDNWVYPDRVYCNGGRYNGCYSECNGRYSK